MKAELEAIKNALDKGEDGESRDYDLAVQLSHDYVAANPEEFDAETRAKPLEGPDGIVSMMDVFLQAGLMEWYWRCQTWVLHTWPPQRIGGEYRAEVRIGN